MIQRRPLTTYFLLAFVFTWLILSPGVGATLGWWHFPLDGTVLTILGGLGPLLATLVVTQATSGRSGVRRFWRGLWQTPPVKWWVIALLLPAGLFGLAAGMSLLTGAPAPNPDAGVFLGGGNLLAVVLLLLLGSIGEEPGWRGFALVRLQRQHTPLRATLIVTFFWWLWHLPTYWTLPMAMGAVQQFGFAVAFAMQLVVLLALSLLCAWVFNEGGGAVWLPVLLHAGWNFWVGAFGQEASLFLLPLFLGTAVVVGLVTKGRLGLPNKSESQSNRNGIPHANDSKPNHVVTD